MSRQRRYYHRRKEELIRLLGGRCAIPGCCNDDLQFDHPNGRDYEARKLSSCARIARYWRDYEAGNLRLLCQYHNATIYPDVPF